MDEVIRFINFSLQCGWDDKLCWYWNDNGLTICLFCMALFSAVTVRGESAGRQFWVYSLVLVVLKAFAGALVAPILIGKLPDLLVNDYIVIFSVIAFWIVNYTPLVHLLEIVPIRCIWASLAMIFRTHAICRFTKLAFEIIIPAKPLYSIAVVCLHFLDCFIRYC